METFLYPHKSIGPESRLSDTKRPLLFFLHMKNKHVFCI